MSPGSSVEIKKEGEIEWMNTAQIKDRQKERAKERTNKSNGLTNERKEGKTKQE